MKKGTQVSSQTEIFFENYKGTIIGITGTKGKGTTSSLIYQILKKAGFKAHLVGNIGKPVFQTLLKTKGGKEAAKEIFVYELSSHQLQNLKKSPQIAVFLNLFPDHLDYYKNLKEYQKAKENIVLHQKKEDFLVYNADDKIARKMAEKTPAQKIAFSLKSPITYLERSLKLCYMRGEGIFWDKERIISKTEIPLKGNFNVLNVMAAISAAKILDVPSKKIRGAVRAFKPLPHRLEFVGKHKGIYFYNDSMSTIPEVSIAALEALGKGVKTLILGGSEKGSDYSALAERILRGNVKNLILFPITGNEIWKRIKKAYQKQPSLKKKKPPRASFVFSMQRAVEIAYQQTRKGEICLLSPGSASFTLFRDYRQRGNLFKKLVKNYAKSKGAKK